MSRTEQGKGEALVHEVLAEIGQAIEARRKELAMTQTDVAFHAGTTPTRVSHIENARVAGLRLETVARVAKAVGLRLRVEQAA